MAMGYICANQIKHDWWKRAHDWDTCLPEVVMYQAMPCSSNMENICVFYLLFITARQIQYSTAKPKKNGRGPSRIYNYSSRSGWGYAIILRMTCDTSRMMGDNVHGRQYANYSPNGKKGAWLSLCSEWKKRYSFASWRLKYNETA